MTAETPALTRTHKILIGMVAVGATVIAAIGFAGSYSAVRELAAKKGFGDFAYAFPIGIDAGICVLLALDLLLTWIRIPFPLLRQTAWLLTAATIAFNGAAAWPDPLGVGMHAVIPILFVVAVEAARHAVGRIADITADKHMEGVRFTRWLLAPVPTFRLWRRMKLWELRSYDEVIQLEQDRLVYQARLRSRFGRTWRRKAPVESLMPLRLARYGVPLAKTAPAGLAAAGIEAPAELFPGERAPELPPAGVPDDREQVELERVVEDDTEAETAVSEAEQPVEAPVAEEQSSVQEEPFELTEQYLYDVFCQYATTYSTDQSWFFPDWEQLVEASATWYGVVVPGDTAPADLDAFAQWYLQRLPGRPEETASAPAAQPQVEVADAPSALLTQPEPVPEQVPQGEPEPVGLASAARGEAPKRVQARVEDDQVEDGAPAGKSGRRGGTRDQVAEIYRGLPGEIQALRGRPLAAAIVEASGDKLKVDTVRRTHITEELLAEYLRGGPS
ncbi:DUF2637 domain-containing protein [Streptomyces rugosispiralis]|uniref:DUF2637 domain-containing protein n=1 Tax=Streptomyces rugosispiralis TaxID=2967341 RepID=A0ABT1VBJ6_9ACTN|nr:DUF2637 domain-containing protein [Streptomyces rugosispiralis]MCQ8194676.1 DUF2637 domain-containing protein [Streptomyces rugosispiralis]